MARLPDGNPCVDMNAECSFCGQRAHGYWSGREYVYLCADCATGENPMLGSLIGDAISGLYLRRLQVPGAPTPAAVRVARDEVARAVKIAMARLERDICRAITWNLFLDHLSIAEQNDRPE